MYDPTDRNVELRLIDRPTNIVAFKPIRECDFASVATLAKTIWREHYTTIISREQIEYMLAGRFTPENLQKYVRADDRWMETVRLDSSLIGYCSYALSTTPREMKLEQLYLLPAFHGRGIGRSMLDRAEQQCRLKDCNLLMLQVNKHNEKAIRAYNRAGYRVRGEAVVDIGNGFVMDDFIMEKHLQS
jgi:ribosomal protein S18 acetylase RimI-like enzyme